jgi:FeS assembly SUF system regulator
MTDYGIVLMAHFARQNEGMLLSSKSVAAQTSLTAPTVSKLLKTLTREGLLDSVRGAQGGYKLSRAASEIDVSEIIEAIEGPVAMTECADPRVSTCDDHSNCPLQSHWNHINLAVKTALQAVTLDKLAAPIPNYILPTRRVNAEAADA